MKHLAVALVALLLAACGSSSEYPRQERAPGAGGIAFVENRKCAECHQNEFQQWLGSDHQKSMQPATEETVRGDFDNVSVTFFGITTRFHRQDGKFMVHTEGPDGKMHGYQVRYTFGVEPLQQYLIPFPGGRLQCLTVAWDTVKKRWFHLYPKERIRPDDTLHWTGRYQRWNLMCAECHSTNLRKNYDPESDTYRTAWDEINVSCQACHGPGAAHVKWAGALPRDLKPPEGDNKLVVNFRAGDSRYQVDQCARCHARRHEVSENNLHGRPFMDDYQAATLRDGLYFADGQILDEVYVYGSFLQSRMYHRGVRCTDCHNPHTLKRKLTGNQLCTHCHQPDPPARFPTLKKKTYDSPEHHFHQPGSKGAQCVECHMPQRTYMVVDPRRDHSFRIPRPDLTIKVGAPNTCNHCHGDRSPKWAVQAIEKWYGSRKPAGHFATVLAAGRAGEPGAMTGLVQLAGDPKQPAIVRATALELLRNYGPEGFKVMISCLNDDEPLVRAVAAGGIDRLEPAPRIDAVAPVLTDPIRAVRQEAARVLASVPRAMLDARQRAAFDAALAQYRSVQLATADTPGAHLNLGLIDAATGNFEQAVAEYRRAIDFDPLFLPAELNLATLLNQLHRNDEAEKVLRDAIRHSPGEGELRYSLGLLLGEQDRLDEAARSLESAAQLMPSRARVHYNYALALQHLGRPNEAETELLLAYEADPGDPSILNALVIFYVQQRRLEAALTYAVKLVKLVPDHPGPRDTLEQIERELKKRR